MDSSSEVDVVSVMYGDSNAKSTSNDVVDKSFNYTMDLVQVFTRSLRLAMTGTVGPEKTASALSIA